jgi:hypothetical protein
MIMQVQDQNGRLAAIRAAFPKEGLFAEKQWLLSPEALPIDRKSLADSVTGCLFFSALAISCISSALKASSPNG